MIFAYPCLLAPSPLQDGQVLVPPIIAAKLSPRHAGTEGDQGGGLGR